MLTCDDPRGDSPIGMRYNHSGWEGGSISNGNRDDRGREERSRVVVKDVVVAVSAYRAGACAGYVGVECQDAELKRRIGVEAFPAIRKVNIPSGVDCADIHRIVSAGANDLAERTDCGRSTWRTDHVELSLLHKERVRKGGRGRSDHECARVVVDRHTWGCACRQRIHDCVHGLQVRR